tara:strand:- start:322 stop:513 length:192 start_codon:yes stop_codon:yes gene_type:complete
MKNKKIETLKNSEQYKFSSKKDQKKMIEDFRKKQAQEKRNMEAEGRVLNYQDEVKKKYGGGLT